MTQTQMSASARILVETQHKDVRGLAPKERDALIISFQKVQGKWVILSRYGEEKWLLVGGTTNRAAHTRVLDFTRVPPSFRQMYKAVIYRYLRNGRPGMVRPGATSVRSLFDGALFFVRHLDKLKINRFGAVAPMACANFVAECKEIRQTRRKEGKPLAAATLRGRLSAVEALYELSQYTDDAMPTHPWAETSSLHMTGLTGLGDPRRQRGGTTPLIPDDVFETLFQRAWELVEQADRLLSLRDDLQAIAAKEEVRRLTGRHVRKRLTRHLNAKGWTGGLVKFNETLLDLRTACYVVVASVSGCRNHELAFIQSNACYRTEDDEGETYWWMRSQSTKTDAGHTEWMVPEAAVTALAAMDRWAKPYQATIEAEIAKLSRTDPLDPRIAVAQEHLGAVFLGNKGNQVRTLTGSSCNESLKKFSKACGLDWQLASHQFRRKFANYAARSQFGDLRYLREHFKHWSQDMTNGYALNESQEMALYVEIQDELDALKDGVVDQWLRSDEPLAGGYGHNIVAWRGSAAVTIFKDRRAMVRSIAESTAIRSNGHAWCTADDNLCVGNGGLEPTRCSGCDNAVIGRVHGRLYQRLYNDLKDVLECDDIGEGGLARVRRDLERCRTVLIGLGYDPEKKTA